MPLLRVQQTPIFTAAFLVLLDLSFDLPGFRYFCQIALLFHWRQSSTVEGCNRATYRCLIFALIAISRIGLQLLPCTGTSPA
jgi:hypothetical protein